MPDAIYIDRTQLQAALKELDKVANRFVDEEWRREVLKGSAEFVVEAARKRQKKSKAVHYYYRNRRPGRRRERGSAVGDRVKIRPGNLKMSIQHLRKLKKAPVAVIGPNIKKRLGNLKNLGRSPANTSGFYAWMAQKHYSGAEDFRKDIMEPALTQTTSQVVAYMSKKITQRTTKTGRQLRFWQ